MAKKTTSSDELLTETVRLLQCLVARDMAKTGVTQQIIAKYLKKSKSDVGPMVQGIKKSKEEP